MSDLETMELRDLIAGLVLAGLLSNNGDYNNRAVVREAFSYADIFMQERAK